MTALGTADLVRRGEQLCRNPSALKSEGGGGKTNEKRKQGADRCLMWRMEAGGCGAEACGVWRWL